MLISEEHLLKLVRPPRLMTIGIGIIASDAIILASDSRTESDDDSKRLDLSKITLINIPRFRCGIVQSGKTEFSTRAVRNITEASEANPASTVREFVSLVEKCCAEMRRYANSISINSAMASIESRFRLLVGMRNEETSVLFTIDSLSSHASEPTDVATIGTGAILADYMLDGISVKDLASLGAAGIAIYSVGCVLKKDKHCEAPIRLALLYPNDSFFMPYPSITSFEGVCSEFEIKRRKEWAKLVGSEIIDRWAEA